MPRRRTVQPAAISPALLLMMLGRQVREKTDAELRNQGLSLRHLSALGHLAHQPGLSYSELARRDGITAQSMQSTLLQLQEIGAVERLYRARSRPHGGPAGHRVRSGASGPRPRGAEGGRQRLLDAIGNENGRPDHALRPPGPNSTERVGAGSSARSAVARMASRERSQRCSSSAGETVGLSIQVSRVCSTYPCQPWQASSTAGVISIPRWATALDHPPAEHLPNLRMQSPYCGIAGRRHQQRRPVQLRRFEDSADERPDPAAQLLVRRQRQVRRGPQHHLGGGCLDHGVLELLLRAEVVEQQRGGDLRLGRDQFDAQFAVRVRHQHPARGLAGSACAAPPAATVALPSVWRPRTRSLSEYPAQQCTERGRVAGLSSGRTRRRSWGQSIECGSISTYC